MSLMNWFFISIVGLLAVILSAPVEKSPKPARNMSPGKSKSTDSKSVVRGKANKSMWTIEDILGLRSTPFTEAPANLRSSGEPPEKTIQKKGKNSKSPRVTKAPKKNRSEQSPLKSGEKKKNKKIKGGVYLHRSKTTTITITTTAIIIIAVVVIIIITIIITATITIVIIVDV